MSLTSNEAWGIISGMEADVPSRKDVFDVIRAELAAAQEDIARLTTLNDCNADGLREAQRRIVELQKRELKVIFERELRDCKMAAAAVPHQVATQLDRLAAALREVLAIIKSNDNWWIDCPDKGGFDVDAIEAALQGVPPAVDWRALGQPLADWLFFLIGGCLVCEEDLERLRPLLQAWEAAKGGKQ